MPNTKTKKFDFQVFLAVSLILLVICCATVCVVLSNNESGVAHAQVEEVVTNLQFSVSDGFYVNKLTSTEFEKIFEYFTLYTSGDTFSITSISGYFHLNYNGSQTSKDVYFHLNIGKVTFGPQVLRQFEVLLDNFNDERLFSYSFVGEQSQFESSYTYMEHAGDYFFNMIGNHTSSGTFANQLVNIFGLTNVTSLDSLDFTFYNTSNLGCLISPNHTFATIPDLGTYDEGYQAGYDDGIVAGIEEANTSYSDGYKAALESVKSINLTSNLQYFNRYSYQYLENDLWKQAQTTQINSQVWLNNTTSDYLFTTKYFNLSNLNSLIAQTQYKNFTLYAVERHQGGSSLSFTIAVESLSESFSISFYDGSRLTYTLELSNTYQNGLPVSYGTLPIGYPFTHIVLNYIDSHALFTLDAVNQIVITANNFVVDSYNTALEQGFNNGYQQGYSTALELYANNDYSFFSLFTSVFDAPITAIVGKWGDSDGDGVYQREGGMLNFYIPGLDINFAPFLLSLFTIGIIVLIIRFILARKS